MPHYSTPQVDPLAAQFFDGLREQNFEAIVDAVEQMLEAVVQAAPTTERAMLHGFVHRNFNLRKLSELPLDDTED